MTVSSEATERPVRTWQVWLIAVFVMLGLAVAASSDSVRVWTNPEPGDAQPADTVERDAPTDRSSAEPAEHSLPAWIGTILQVLAIGVFAAITILGVYGASQWRPSFRSWRFTPPGLRWEAFAEPLPDAADHQVRVDADAARASLAIGPPRNAIVACWIQLEADVAAAGLPRRVAETSSEYAERVIGRSSVDAGPIRELAALYREARYSTHEFEPEHRARAGEALDRVVGALGEREEAVT